MNFAPLVVLSLIVLVPAARADIPPSDTQGCSNSTAGAACKTDSGAAGTCQTSTCTRADYSNGPPPKRVPYDCLKCVSSGAAPAPTPAEPGNADPKKCSVAPTELSGLALVLALLGRRRRA